MYKYIYIYIWYIYIYILCIISIFTHQQNNKHLIWGALLFFVVPPHQVSVSAWCEILRSQSVLPNPMGQLTRWWTHTAHWLDLTGACLPSHVPCSAPAKPSWILAIKVPLPTPDGPTMTKGLVSIQFAAIGWLWMIANSHLHPQWYYRIPHIDSYNRLNTS